jgi:ATP-dependent DNA helicase RecG
MKEEDFGHKSVPRNPLLFGLFYRMDLVEQIGSGIRRTVKGREFLKKQERHQ